MKRKAFAIAGGLLLGFVAVFTLISVLKAAIGLAIIAFAGRGLLRLWASGTPGTRNNAYFRHNAYPELGPGSQGYPANGLQPMYGKQAQQGIIPIW